MLPILQQQLTDLFLAPTSSRGPSPMALALIQKIRFSSSCILQQLPEPLLQMLLCVLHQTAVILRLQDKQEIYFAGSRLPIMVLPGTISQTPLLPSVIPILLLQPFTGLWYRAATVLPYIPTMLPLQCC